MKDDIKLVINGMVADIDEEIRLPMNYTYELLENPTAIKNNFSKTITLKGTPNNNKIFNSIYLNDRMTVIDSASTIGVNFNPIRRIPFEIYRNGDMAESGYLQLSNIKRNKDIVNYEVVLYGGLGDFFYNLAYDDEYTPKKLSDLHFGVVGSDGNVLPTETEMDMFIDAFNVSENWNYLKYNYNMIDDDNYLNNYITFVPCYNGTYENFDNNKVLINTRNTNVFPTGTTVDGKTYGLYNGYLMMESDVDYTEWDLKMLRSYMQRPALRMTKLFKAISNPENNGGYTVELDNTFFNDNNPYWKDAYILFPLLNSDRNEDISNNLESTVISLNNWIGKDAVGTVRDKTDSPIIPSGDTFTVDSNNNIDLSDIDTNGVITVDFNFKLCFRLSNVAGAQTDVMNIAGLLNQVSVRAWTVSNYTAQLVAYDATTNEVIGFSDLLAFTNRNYDKYGLNVTQWNDDLNKRFNLLKSNVTQTFGSFHRFNNGQPFSEWKFIDENGYDIFKLSLKCVPKDKIKVVMKIYRFGISIDGFPAYNSGSLFLTVGDNVYYENAITDGTFYCILQDANITMNYSELSITSGKKIGKKDLLRSESTPLDFLLSYSKQFGLLWLKDIKDKKIKVMTRNTFFSQYADVVNLEERIDRSKDIEIKPILFDKKWYIMQAADAESYYLDKYKSDYGITYGQQRLNTNYNFNSDEENLYEDSIYQNIASARDTSPYYRVFKNNNNDEVPSFFADKFNYLLYDNNLESTEVEHKAMDSISTANDLYYMSGYDLCPKPCLYSINGNSKELSEIDNSIVIYNGCVELKDVKGGNFYYKLTDDVPEMLLLNDGKLCHLYTTDNYNVDESTEIALNVFYLPQFTRYAFSNDRTISHSLDYGVPQEIYLTDTLYPDNTTLYYRFWQSMLKEQFDVNTRLCTCYVNLNGLDIGNLSLSRIYYFDNSYWILNKIYSYDITTNAMTKCEFIKVLDVGTYTNGQRI